jgi:glycine/D-amino acid oxidase-like deaminating enzyme
VNGAAAGRFRYEPAARRPRVRPLPQDDSGCGWIGALPPPPEPRRLRTAERADAVVLGAGFTGLAVAARLAELCPGWRIVLLEAARAGHGASGRSSGFVVDRAHFIARLELETSRRYRDLCRFGIERLRAAVRGHGIDCCWDESGWIHAAATPEGVAALPGLRRWLEVLDEPYEPLDAAGLERITGTRCYRAGLRLPGSVLVQPAALARGLAAALPGPVELYEESPVRAIERGRSGFRVGTGEGSVAAPRLFLGTNGYSPALGFLRRRVFPLLTFGSLTRPLTPGEQERLGGEREWGILSEDPMGSTVRRTRDQRLLIRNTVCYSPRLRAGEAARRAARALHRKAFEARFPGLREVELEHSWEGVMGVSPNRGHCFGELEDGVFAAAGYSGAGIAMGTTAGTLLADLAAGGSAVSPMLDAMLTLPEPARLPPEPFLGLGIRWRVARMNASASPVV